MVDNPKAESVTRDGEADGFELAPGFQSEREPYGPTRLAVAVPTAWLRRVHGDLIGALSPPVGFLYRQRVDRRAVAKGEAPPEGAPPRDFLALELDPQRVLGALATAEALVYHDARCEVWVRGAAGEQVVLDADGLLYCYPDDPAFRDVCLANGLQERKLQTLADRDYVKHWFHAENDALEDALIASLGLSEMPPRTA